MTDDPASPPGRGPSTTLVLLPGLDGTAIFFAPLLRHLPSWITPIVLSYPPTGANGYDDIFAKIKKDIAGLGRVALLGWSFGGPLALMFAARRPGQVSAIILYSSFVTPPRPRLVRFRFAVRGPVIALVRAARRLRLLAVENPTGEFWRAKAATWRNVSSTVLAARARAVLETDARPLLKTCTVPLLYLSATEDRVVERRSRDEVLALAPHAQTAEVKGPHFALFHNPTEAARHIARFLA